MHPLIQGEGSSGKTEDVKRPLCEKSPGERGISWVMCVGILFAAVTVAMFLYTGHLNRQFIQAEREKDRVVELGGTIRHLDEVLTMSARMAAATGARNPNWTAPSGKPCNSQNSHL
jgi:hypothetical protein